MVYFSREMVTWSEAIRCSDSGYFCRQAVEQSPHWSSCQICIVCDCRRPSDLEFFGTLPGCSTFTLRIESSAIWRQNRGWKFTPGIDDAETETALDSCQLWDFTLVNDGQRGICDSGSFNRLMENIRKLILI